jgi:Glu-tRNA(Gln) amidotransferase subunit E-like FAD-binding protein
MRENKDLRQERIDKDLFDANIRLMDENKFLKRNIQKALDYIEERKDYAAMKVIKRDLLKILSGLVD